MNCTPEEYLDLHNDGWPDHNDGQLHCQACSRPFTPEGPDEMRQADDDCLCPECAKVTAELEAGLL
jgi:hypothetical protein